MLNRSRLIVVIPALDEAHTIESVVESILKIGATPLVVDDGSTDNTAEIAYSVGALVVKHESNLGYESALNTGINEASLRGYELVATFDADRQLNPDDLTRFVHILDSGNYDLVVGIRDYKNRFTEKLLSLLGRFRFGLKDPLCGLKLYKIDSAEPYFPFDSLNLVGMELAFKMIDGGCKVIETPIHVQRRSGESRYGRSFRGEINIIKSFFRVLKSFKLFRQKSWYTDNI
jgi:glycosyltransferase involved in cell wall biosynthesis